MVQRHQSILYAVQNYGKRLFSFIRSRVKNDADAEDIPSLFNYLMRNLGLTENTELRHTQYLPLPITPSEVR